MSDNAAAQERVEVSEVEASVELQNGNVYDAATESRARRMGWVAKDEFRGDGGAQWVDADTFVRRAEQSADILIERNKALDRRLEASEKTFSVYKQNSEKQLGEMAGTLKDLQDTLVDFRNFATSANERAYKKARKDLETEMRRAVTDADVDRFDAIKARVDELDEEASHYVANREQRQAETQQPQVRPQEAPQAPPQEVEAPPPPPEVSAWISRNQWFLNPDFSYMNQYAQRVHMRMLREEPGLTLAQNLDKVTDLTRRKFPEEFGVNPRREEAAVTASSTTATTRAGGARRKNGYNDLPAEAKAACDRYVKTIPNYTQDEYLKAYFIDEDE